MATYTCASELDYTNLHEWDIVFIGWYKGKVARDYINFDDSHLWHKETCDTFHDLHSLARAVYGDTSTIQSAQHFPTFTNTHDSTSIVRELMLMYNGVEPRRGVPMLATEAGPIYDDARVRAMLDGTSVSNSSKPLDEPVACAPEPVKKKRLISFPKIR